MAVYNCLSARPGGRVTTMIDAGAENRGNLDRFFDLSLDACLIVDAGGLIRKANPAFVKLLGYPESEVVGTDATALVHPEDLPSAQAEFAALKAAGLRVNFTRRFRTSQGDYLWLEWSAFFVPDEGLAYCIARDVTEPRAVEQKLKESEAWFRCLTENAPDVMYRYRLGPKLAVDYMGPNVATVLGYTPEEYYADPDLSFKIAHPDDRSFIEALVRDPERVSLPFTMRWRHRDGRLIWLEHHRSIIRNSAGEPVAVEGIARDVTQQKEAEQALARERAQLLALFEAIDEVIYVSDPRTYEILFANGTLRRLAGRDVVGEKCFRTLQGRDEPCPFCTNDRIFGENTGKIHVWETQSPVTQRWFRCMDRAISWLDGRMVRYELAIDISDLRRAEERLRHDAFHDQLTGLPNRALLLDRLAHRIQRWKRSRQPMFAILFLDLDRFKLINDSLGHNLGDKVLVEVARQLEASLRPGDTLARLGEDEFAIVLDEIGDAWRAVLVAERLQSSLKAPIQVEGHQLYLSSSIGVAVSGESCAGPEEMLRDADTAMFGAKQRGRARVVLFDEQMHRDAVAALNLERDLRQAVERKEFAVFYQPVVRLSDRATTGYEALVRWRRPAQGLLKPEEFLQVAEETGLITEIDDWMLRQALTQLRDWSARTGRPPSMYLNLSGRSLLDPELVSRLETLLRETKVDPALVHLELTEGTVQAAWETAGARPTSMQTIESLRRLRVGLCLDDFGTGYSCLSRLSELPITHVKMDRSFVSRLCSRERDAAVARTIVALARTMGVEVIAEGVETEEQAAALSALGCEYAQGYLFSEPVSGDLAGEWVPE